MIYIKQYGEYIKNNRIHLKLTQLQLGQKLGITESAISKYENNLIRLDMINLISLSYIFGVTIGDFLTGKYPADFSVKNKYKILQILEEPFNNEFNARIIAEEFLLAMKSLKNHYERFSHNSISDDEITESSFLIKSLVHLNVEVVSETDPFLRYKNFNPCNFEELLTLRKKYSDKDKYKLKFGYPYDCEFFIKNVNNRELVFNILKFFEINEETLKLSIKYKNIGAIFYCLINGVKLKDDNEHELLLEHFLKHKIYEN